MIGSENDQNEIIEMIYNNKNKKTSNQELYICDNMETNENLNNKISAITMSPISNSLKKNIEFTEALTPNEEIAKIYDGQSIKRNSQEINSIDIYQSPLSPISIASDNLEPTVIVPCLPINLSLTPKSISSENDNDNDIETENENDNENKCENSIKFSQSPTVFEYFTKNDIKWCRYCGTTQTSSWRQGPWGKKTLCNKHGCDYKGYGFTVRLPRLNLNSFLDESMSERIRPVIQEYCCICFKNEATDNNILVMCNGCYKSYHQNCHPNKISDSVVKSTKLYYCSEQCEKTKSRKRIDVIDLPRKNLPFMFNKGITRNSEIIKAQIKKVDTKEVTKTRTRTRKKRNSSNLDSSILSFSNTTIIKNYQHSNIPIPTWRVCNTRTKKRKIESENHIEEDISDEVYIKRHLPLEQYEKEDRCGSLLTQTSIIKEKKKGRGRKRKEIKND